MVDDTREKEKFKSEIYQHSVIKTNDFYNQTPNSSGDAIEISSSHDNISEVGEPKKQ